MGRVIERAQADIAAGRLWKARDRLHGALAHPLDERVLPLLGGVLYRMGDLPAAGAIWFASEQDDDRAPAALAAWRERHAGDPVQLWFSLPATLRQLDRPAVHRLRAEASTAGSHRLDGGGRVPVNSPLPVRKRFAVGDVALTAIAGAVVVLAGVGAWTVVGWFF